LHCGLLLIALRRVRDVAITIAPIVLTGFLTLGSLRTDRAAVNFCHIIACRCSWIGVAFHIYFVMSWRSGGSHLLTSSLARGVFFSALATATASAASGLEHPGTASMGKLLMISLVWTLASHCSPTALMGREREERDRRNYFMRTVAGLVQWHQTGALQTASAEAKSTGAR